jgi:hypothetical protein
MVSLGTATVIGVIVLAALLWFFFRTRRNDRLGEMVEKRRSGSKLVARADYVEGLERMPVAIALTSDTFFYENADLQASFELARIDEVEYDNELATGRNVDADSRVLRLRSHGATFEFIMPTAEASKWQGTLTPRRLDQSTARVV